VYRLAWPFRFVAIVLAGALLLTGVVIGVAPRVWSIANAHEELPIVLPEFQPLSQRTYVYDSAGNVTAVFERENSQPIGLEQVPPDVIRAILAVEDNEFYSHKGVNVRGFMRALLSNFSSDAPRQGASTITQQVVKNEFLAGLPRDGRYKALQAHYATMLEKKISKDEILERYLNTVFFGNNAYGLQAAAEVYFGKDAAALTTVEGAFLAGLVRSPSGYDPIRKPERSRARFRQVTDRLADVGIVTKEEAKELAESYVLPEQVRSTATVTTEPSYYGAALREYLLERSNLLGDTEQARANLLYRGGLRIYTTLDPRMQTAAEEARNKLPDNAAGFDAAVISLDTQTGAIKAMVGGRKFEPGKSEINMALVPRQTGSSIKLFILAAALQAGAQPTDVIAGDRPCKLPNPGNEDEPFEIQEGAAGFTGPLNRLTWLSINCAYARLSQIVGLNRMVDSVYRMARSPYLYQGQELDSRRRRPVEALASFATGANEMAPIDMAAGMQTIANQGLHQEPYYVEYIEKPDGTRMYTHQLTGTQVLDPGVALTAVDVLKGVLTQGTASKALSKFPRPAAGKTGTQEDNTNSWFVGSSPQLTTAVWVGNPNAYVPMVCGSVKGKQVCNIPEFRDLDGVTKVQGGTYPARIWGAYMEKALEPFPADDWPDAPGPTRKAVRLYLPGNECLAKLISGALPVPGATTTTTIAPAPVTNPDTGELVPTETTVPAPVVLQAIDSGTTIPPDVLDPLAPLPSTDIKTVVYTCDAPPGTVRKAKAP
jgi:penicillin-binding protein 1A